MFEDLKLWIEAHSIFSGIAISVIAGILLWAAKKVPARLKKRWKTKTTLPPNPCHYMVDDGEMLPPPRRPKNCWCALLLFLGKGREDPDLWEKN